MNRSLMIVLFVLQVFCLCQNTSDIREKIISRMDANTEMHVISIYESKKDDDNVLPVNIEIKEQEARILLVLCAYRATKWIVIGDIQKVQLIILLGFEEQRVLGVPEPIIIEIKSSLGVCKDDSYDYYFMETQLESIVPGKGISSFQWEYHGSSFAVSRGVKVAFQEKQKARRLRLSSSFPTFSFQFEAPYRNGDKLYLADFIIKEDATTIKERLNLQAPVKFLVKDPTFSIYYGVVENSVTRVFSGGAMMKSHGSTTVGYFTNTGEWKEIKLNGNLERFSWARGLAFDSVHGKLLLIAGDYFYTYAPANDKWTCSKLDLMFWDLVVMVYSPDKNCIYAIQGRSHDGEITTLVEMSLDNSGKIVSAKSAMLPDKIFLQKYSDEVSMNQINKDYLIVTVASPDFFRGESDYVMYTINLSDKNSVGMRLVGK